MVKRRPVKPVIFLITTTAFLILTSFKTKLYETAMKIRNPYIYWSGQWRKLFQEVSPEIKQSEREKSIARNEAHFTAEDWMDSWVSVTPKISVYSAYWDTRYCTQSTCLIRVIGIETFNDKLKTDLKCILNYSNFFKESPKKPTIEILPENHGKRASAIYILCHVAVNSSTQSVPTGLILTESEDWRSDSSTTEIQVHVRDGHRWKKPQNNTKSSKIAVCVRPLFGPFDNIKLLAEFVAYYSNIGVNHFSFYDYNTTSRVKQYLNMLSQEGFSLDFLPWNISKKLKGAWEMGQLAHVQDCIYRHLFYFDFVLLIDLDEYVLLKQENTLQELIEKEDNKRSPKGSYMFRNSFFWLGNCDTPDMNNSRYLNIQLCIKREPKIWPSMQRSKVLLRPEAVLTGGIHFVWKYSNKKWKNLSIDPKFAMLHHYRRGKTVAKPSVKDTSALKHVESILKSKPIEIWKEYFSK